MEILIEKLAFGGAGLGRVDGKVCFVPFTAPGDLAKVRVTRSRKSYQEGELLELIRPAAARTAPPCGAFGLCGGCCWQHLPYDVQVKAKQDIFAEILGRIARVQPDVFLPMIPAPSPLGYRSRVQFKVRRAEDGLHCGFYRRGSHFVIDIPGGCLIADDRVNLLYGSLLPLLGAFPDPARLPQIDVAVGDDGGALLLFHYIGEAIPEVSGWLEKTIPGRMPVTGVFLQTARKVSMRKVWGEERVSYSIPSNLYPELPEIRLSFRCGGFSQVNYSQNLALIGTVLEWADLKGTEKVLDLFCGNGNFSLPISRFCGEVTGIEDFRQSIEDAVHNARQNLIPNTRFSCAPAEKALRYMADAGERFDLVLIDPPRTGAFEAVRIIAEMSPEKILYVSCDPATLARDIAELRKRGYQVAAVRAVDMFPQTHHIESITLLRKT